MNLRASLKESAALLYLVAEGLSVEIARAAQSILDALRQRATLFTLGNGGSATQASHLAAELVGKFGLWRKALPAISLSADPAILTALGNDLGFEAVFERQVQALVSPRDIVLALSTSGDSENIIRGLMAAKHRGAFTIALLGGDGGKVAQLGLADIALIVPSGETPRIQEAHLAILHVICQEVERGLSE